jgi:sec-independent protein translocase protein TatC
MRPHRLPREEEATLVEHLEELRGRILVSLAAVAVATAVAFAFHNHILVWLARPLPPEHRHLAAFGVTEPFSVSVAVSLYAGLLFALPVILSQLWSFLAPGVRPQAPPPHVPVSLIK